MVIWYLHLAMAIILIGMFYAGIASGTLARMPGKPLPVLGIQFEHAWGIVLVLVPHAGWLPIDIIVYALWIIGLWVYLDDYYQHFRRAHGDPGYTSPLHRFGWYWLRPRLAKYVWKGFEDV